MNTCYAIIASQYSLNTMMNLMPRLWSRRVDGITTFAFQKVLLGCGYNRSGNSLYMY